MTKEQPEWLIKQKSLYGLEVPTSVLTNLASGKTPIWLACRWPLYPSAFRE